MIADTLYTKSVYSILSNMFEVILPFCAISSLIVKSASKEIHQCQDGVYSTIINMHFFRLVPIMNYPNVVSDNMSSVC